MKIVEFYKGEGRTSIGETLDSIMRYNHNWMEADHDYIQWLFPSNEPSECNSNAPVLTKEEADIFKSEPYLQFNMLKSLEKFLDFLGIEFKISPETLSPTINAIKPTDKRPYPLFWMDEFNHNMLRVTRCLKSLRLTGLGECAKVLYDFLAQDQYRVKFSQNTFDHWTKAVKDDLWAS